ncbi:MAG: hypothetical protein A2Y33_13190 [Spirochaetes bacterium GWF1_51_8]|nr:MAG: hypothetical protein A2Y33_13190 [Spirochaetes bacterium GWF1_51_8]
MLDYLKDWKNIVMHSLIGLAILGITVFLPIPLHARIFFLVAVVAFNILRMRMEKKAKMKKAEVPVEIDPSDKE